MLIPLYGFVPGDSLGVLVLAQSNDTVAAVAQSLAQAVCMRVVANGRLGLSTNGIPLDPARTISEAGLTALDRIELLMENG